MIHVEIQVQPTTDNRFNGVITLSRDEYYWTSPAAPLQATTLEGATVELRDEARALMQALQRSH